MSAQIIENIAGLAALIVEMDEQSFGPSD